MHYLLYLCVSCCAVVLVVGGCGVTHALALLSVAHANHSTQGGTLCPMNEHSQCPLWKRVVAHVWVYLLCTGSVVFSLFVLLEALYRGDVCVEGYEGYECAFAFVTFVSVVFCALGCYAAVPFLGRMIHPAVLLSHVDDDVSTNATRVAEEASEEELVEDAPADAARGEAPQDAQEEEEGTVQEAAPLEDASREEERSQEGAEEDAAEDDTSLGWRACYYLCVTSVLAVLLHRPFVDFSTIDLIEKGMVGKQAPGWASINCMTDVQPKSIDVRTDLYAYFVLADPQWRVASANGTKIATQGDYSWVVAPILYSGPVKGCRTKYPLFAVCVAKTKGLSPASCGWDKGMTGAWTPILLMTGSGDFSYDDRKVFWEERVPNPYNNSERVKLHHENLFQFGSNSYGDAVAYLEQKRNGYPSVRLKAMAAWLCATLPVVLWTIAALCSNSAPAPLAEQQSDGSGGEEEMSTQPSEPDVPPYPEDEVLLTPAVSEENIQVELRVTRL